jgi:hypothetical protein
MHIQSRECLNEQLYVGPTELNKCNKSNPALGKGVIIDGGAASCLHISSAARGIKSEWDKGCSSKESGREGKYCGFGTGGGGCSSGLSDLRVGWDSFSSIANNTGCT